MLHSYNHYLLILESKRKDDLKKKYVNKMGMDNSVFDEIYSSKLHSDWLLKTYSKIPKEDIKNHNGDLSLQQILIKYVNIFTNNQETFDGININNINSIDEMRETINELRGFDDAEKKYGDDIWVLVNTYEWFIYKPYSYEVSEIANTRTRETNWCTTYGNDHFTEYFGENGGLLYVINKLDSKKDIAFEMSQKSSKSEITTWDHEDDKIESYKKLEKAISSLLI